MLEERQRRRSLSRLFGYYPDEGEYRRELYPKHLAFFAAGRDYRERLAMAANRVGKTEGMGGYETTLHLTGLYPSWWEGKRFARPVRAWMAGKTNETTRDIVQRKMCGPIRFDGAKKRLAGTGLIPGEMIGAMSWKQGVPDLLDVLKVQHVSGGWSELGVKSYQQGRGAFEGTEIDVVWLDEEPPSEIYEECLIRTAGTGGRESGIIMVTFTPLDGMTEVVRSFLAPEVVRLG